LSERHSRREFGELTVDLQLRQPLATHHHTGAAGEIADALQWIRVEQDEVGAIPGDDRPETTILFQRARYVSSNVPRSRLIDLVRPHSRRRHFSNLAVKRKARHHEKLRRVRA